MSNLLSVDIETACNQNCIKACDHALFPHTAKITKIGVYSNEFREVFDAINQFANFLNNLPSFTFVGQNFKFDIKHLAYHGLQLPLEDWAHDTKLMASVCLTKVSTEYLQYYEEKRTELNKLLPKGYSHRKGSQYSLKTLAPYFLDVEPFWEDPTNHALNEYVLKDCEYTYKLFLKLLDLTQKDNTYKFYSTYLMPWEKMLTQTEQKGITIDFKTLVDLEQKTQNKKIELEQDLNKLWEPAKEKAFKLRTVDLLDKYKNMSLKARAKLKNPSPDKIRKLDVHYAKLLYKAQQKLCPELNFNSPAQMSWLFKNYLRLNITDINGKDSTGKPVLMYYSHKRNDINTYLEYKKQNKLLTSFFPTYKEKHINGILHCDFNITGTRTGRLSSRNPNLQQVPSNLHSLFVARTGHLLATYDMSAIEAKLIAYYSEDPILLDIVFSNTDFHGFNTKIYFPELNCSANKVKEKHKPLRDFVKTLGYALFYGAGKNRVKSTAQKNGEDWPLSRCAEIVENLQETYKQVFDFKKQIDKTVLSTPIPNLFGRYQYFDDPNDIYMKNFNTLIQSSASDMVLESARKLNEIPWINVLLLVHDEIVMEIPEDKAKEAESIIPEIMTDYKLKTNKGLLPLQVEGKICKTWSK